MKAIDLARNGLDESDLEYHCLLMDELKSSQKAFQEADVQYIKAQGAIEAWSRLIMRKYGLTEGDKVEENGQFVRQS